MQQKRWFSGFISHITLRWSKYLSEDCLNKLPTPQKAAESTTPYLPTLAKELGGGEIPQIKNVEIIGGEYPILKICFEKGGKPYLYYLSESTIYWMLCLYYSQTVIYEGKTRQYITPDYDFFS